MLQTTSTVSLFIVSCFAFTLNQNEQGNLINCIQILLFFWIGLNLKIQSCAVKIALNKPPVVLLAHLHSEDELLLSLFVRPPVTPLTITLGRYL